MPIMAKLSVLLILIVHQSLAELSERERPLCPPHLSSRCIYQGVPSYSEYQYKVDEHPLNIVFQDGKYLRIPCDDSITLDNDALPRFPRLVTIQAVHLDNCPAPKKSLAAALAALNVTGYSKLTMNHVPAHPSWKREHFNYLNVSWLILHANRRVTFEPGSLSSLNLTQLRLANISVDTLPVGLTSLRLESSGTSQLSAEVMKSLKELQFLDVTSTDVSMLENATELRRLYIRGHVGELPDMPWLEELTLDGWVITELKPWKNCGELRGLTVISPNVLRLPDDWLAVCQKLHHLDLVLENLEGLSPHVFRGCVSVQKILVRRSRVKELPLELFKSAKNLITLNLSHNKLENLPSGVFSSSPNIQELDLSYNQLTAGNITTIGTLLSLRNLNLSHNTLGRMCGTGTAVYIRAKSRLSTLIELRKLAMSNCGIPDICDDWISWFPFLNTLDLSRNSIRTLQYENIVSRAATEIDLRGNNITRIEYNKEDCTTVVKQLGTVGKGIIKMDSKLECDCELFKFAFARQTAPKHANIHWLQCTSGKDLMSIPAENLHCDLSPPDDCVPGCVCDLVPNSRPLSCNSTIVLRAHCEAKALPTLYALDSSMDPVELTVTGLQDLSVLKLDGNLQRINLKNNSISNASAAIARLLLSPGRLVSLSGNPLNCACGERYLVEELLNNPDQVEDFSETQCSDMRFLSELKRGECSLLSSGALAALGVLAVAALAAMALAAVLATPELRLRFKIYLFKLGISLPCIQSKEDDEGKRYDAFISFSHHDGRLVMEEIVPVLEKDYHLCLHYRDWPLGGWIPEQIATSVRDSRRTIIVVSENYARSDWARAEFREAHAAAMKDSQPRLLAVLLQEPPPELDPELKLYLSTNTYVKWGDPSFWDKLRYAMPRKKIKKFLPEAA